jgi:hypothetical protein
LYGLLQRALRFKLQANIWNVSSPTYGLLPRALRLQLHAANGVPHHQGQGGVDHDSPR